jgi:hypothetical protein
VLLGDRCSAVCNGTLITFAEAVGARRAEDGDDPLASPEALRFVGDDPLALVDRAIERAATA